MCGRFALAHTPEELTQVFDLAEGVDLAPRYNLAPGTDMPVVRRAPADTRVLHPLRWRSATPEAWQTIRSQPRRTIAPLSGRKKAYCQVPLHLASANPPTGHEAGGRRHRMQIRRAKTK